jgi:hypothetical protein
MSSPHPPLAPPPGAPTLARAVPEPGVNFWIGDAVLADPHAVRARLLAQPRWNLGYPQRAETWPGMRLPDALAPSELAGVEAWVRGATGCTRLRVATAPGGARLDCNVAQLVGADESGPRPHSDRRDLCRYAAVVYLNPEPPAGAGTSFYRLRYANGAPRQPGAGLARAAPAARRMGGGGARGQRLQPHPPVRGRDGAQRDRLLRPGDGRPAVDADLLLAGRPGPSLEPGPARAGDEPVIGLNRPPSALTTGYVLARSLTASWG